MDGHLLLSVCLIFATLWCLRTYNYTQTLDWWENIWWKKSCHDVQKVFISLNCHVLFPFLYYPGLKRRKCRTSGMLIQNRRKRNTNTIKEKYKNEKREIEKQDKKIWDGWDINPNGSGLAWHCLVLCLAWNANGQISSLPISTSKSTIVDLFKRACFICLKIQSNDKNKCLFYYSNN